MTSMKVGNAPVSWGVYEAEAPKGSGPNPPWESVLDAIAEAGYAGTELGPYGYLPTQHDVLARSLKRRGLSLGSSFVAVALEDPARRDDAVAHCLKVAALLHGHGERHLIVADDEDPLRAREAGRIPSDGSLSWSDRQWVEVGRTLDAIGKAVHDRFGMRVVVHHHAGTFVETGREIARLLQQTDPSLVGLLVDTGHATYGGADPVDLLRRHRDRVWYVHFKDVKQDELHRVRTTGISMAEAWRRGVFCPLGSGVVDFAAFTRILKESGYEGWVIVEQDVVPDERGRLHPDPLASAVESRRFLKDSLGI